MRVPRVPSSRRTAGLVAASLAVGLIVVTSACTAAEPEASGPVGSGTAGEAVPPTGSELAGADAAAPGATATLGASDVVESPGDRMELVFCVNLPCPMRGSEDAPVTIIEVSDYRCEYCEEHLRMTQPLIDAEYVDTGKARVVSHVFASTPPSQFVAAAALCADEQGKYFEYQRAAFETRLAYASNELNDQIVEVGAQVGVEPSAFAECLDEGRYLTFVTQTTAEAQQLGVGFTPSFIVNGLMIEGAEDIEVFRRKIDQALEGAGG